MGFSFNHVHLKSRDPQKTAQWYIDNLGARMVSELGIYGYQIDLHGVTVNVTGKIPTQDHEQHYGIEHLAVDTDDLTGVVEKLKSNGARVLEEIRIADGRRIFFIEDPDGVYLEILEARK